MSLKKKIKRNQQLHDDLRTTLEENEKVTKIVE
jgi:hypothetical protein